MVFHSVPEPPRAPPQATTKAMSSTVSVKSQPLHNFSFADLKWGVNQSGSAGGGASSSSSGGGGNRVRKPADSALKSPPPPRHSGSPAERGPKNPEKQENFPRGPDRLVEKPPKKASADKPPKRPPIDEGPVGSPDGVRPKILLRLPVKSCNGKDSGGGGEDAKPEPVADDVGDQARVVAAEAEESAPRAYLLRPRNLVTKKPNGSGGAAAVQQAKPPADAARSRSPTQPSEAGEKKQKRPRLSFTLSKEEIEGDFLDMTGSKPPRRPKKRAKNVQRPIDCLFPGMWLTGLTPEFYRLSETNAKG